MGCTTTCRTLKAPTIAVQLLAVVPVYLHVPKTNTTMPLLGVYAVSPPAVWGLESYKELLSHTRQPHSR